MTSPYSPIIQKDSWLFGPHYISPDSFPESPRPSLSSVWFAGTTIGPDSNYIGSCFFFSELITYDVMQSSASIMVRELVSWQCN